MSDTFRFLCEEEWETDKAVLIRPPGGAKWQQKWVKKSDIIDRQPLRADILGSDKVYTTKRRIGGFKEYGG